MDLSKFTEKSQAALTEAEASAFPRLYIPDFVLACRKRLVKKRRRATEIRQPECTQRDLVTI
jgi:hypothetical protein